MIVNLRRAPRELGRIRLGDRGAKGQPQRLETFRLTSADRFLLDAAAALYGGTPRPWAGKDGQFELYTETNELPCMVPGTMSQHYELWSGGGCQRRCDGETVTTTANGNLTTSPCVCDPDERECALVSRIPLILPTLPGLGVWRLETHGWYAATELPEVVEMLGRLRQGGTYPQATVAIEQRSVKRNGKTKNFPVPVLRIKEALITLLTGEVPTKSPPAALPAPGGQTAPPAARGHATASTAPPAGIPARAGDSGPELVPGPHACSYCYAPPGKPHTAKCLRPKGETS